MPRVTSVALVSRTAARHADWFIDAGYPIQCIADYHEWLQRFEIAMRALPDRQRQQSVLPLLQNPGSLPGPAPTRFESGTAVNSANKFRLDAEPPQCRKVSAALNWASRPPISLRNHVFRRHRVC